VAEIREAVQADKLSSAQP